MRVARKSRYSPLCWYGQITIQSCRQQWQQAKALILVFPMHHLPELVEQGVVAPLDDYLDELGVDLSTMYSETSLESVTFDGSIYAVPLDTHAEIMYFNKDILDQAGVALNDEGQLAIASEDDFYAVCDKIKAVMPGGRLSYLSDK